jgi:hypothetical protein
MGGPVSTIRPPCIVAARVGFIGWLVVEPPVASENPSLEPGACPASWKDEESHGTSSSNVCFRISG